MADLDYDNDLRIDPNALDIEWLDQPRTYMRYAEQLARALKEVDKTKERLEVVKAELDHEIRDAAERGGGKKPTESAISNTVTNHSRYQQAMSDYNDAKYESNLLSSAVRAFDQRKAALENLVRLHASSYFAGPSVPRELSQEFVEAARSKRVSSKAREKMKDVSQRTSKRTR